jgi:hypothetical protein
MSRHRGGRGQPEAKNPANLERFGNNKRIRYLENQPKMTTTKTPKTSQKLLPLGR